MGCAQASTAPARPPAAAFSLSVRGNELVNGEGRAIHLHGVNGPAADYPCTHGYGPIDGPAALNEAGADSSAGQASVVDALLRWSVKAVRLQINEDCWPGINGAPPAVSGANYQRVTEIYVDQLTKRRIYVILDLHWTAPGSLLATQQDEFPDADHAPTLWTSVASAFKSNPAVAFDLFNEPKPWVDPASNWACWRDGCEWASDYTDHPKYRTAGMQQLVNVVRQTGSRNAILIGGLSYSGSFMDAGSPAIDQFEAYIAHDPLNQIAASIHVYPYTYCHSVACWSADIGAVARKYPVITGELGEGDGSPRYPSCDGAFISSYMAWADKQGVSYLGWSWNVWHNCGAMIGDFNGSPINHGLAFEAHLRSLAPAAASGRPAQPAR